MRERENSSAETRGAASSNSEETEPPQSIDATTPDELPGDVEADFKPLPDVGSEAVQSSPAVDPFQHDSLRAQEAFEAAVEAAASGNEDDAVQHYLRAAKIAEMAREWYVAAIACQKVADFLLSPSPPCDLERAFRMYRRAVAAYEQCGLFAEARRVAYRQMCLKLGRAGELRLPFLQRVELFLFWAIAGFGYRPLRVIGTAIVVVLVYALIYWQTGGVQRVGWSGPLSLWHAAYFSGITFATVGYGDFIPAPHTRLLALTEGFFGALLMGLFVAVLANRLSNT